MWAAGLSLPDYLGVWEDVRRTEWARRNVRFHVWTDSNGELLSSLKLYRPRFRIGDDEKTVTVLSAIFTPRRQRGNGYARQMLREVLRLERERGSQLALLFSDIGEKLYRDLGFRSLAAVEHRADPARLGARPPQELRLERLDRPDPPEVRKLHRQGVLRRGMGVLRDDAHWRFLATRSSSFFTRLKDPDVNVLHLRVLREELCVGYVASVEGRGEWNVREVGAIDGDPVLMAQVLRAAAADARARGLKRLRGWLPPELYPLLADRGLVQQRRARAIPMIRVLNGPPAAVRGGDAERCFIPFQDQF